jgi:hypothetical protein
MYRKAAWLAVCGLLVSEAAAFAQVPGLTNPSAPSIFGNPGALGYPGYPTPGYDPLLPMPPKAPPASTPTWPGMAPNIPFPSGPFVNPGPVVPMPAPGGQAAPTYDGVGPKEGASEPYVVPREAATPAPNPVLQPMLPSYNSPPPVYGPPPGGEPACYIQQVPPAEPYALYEGPRYAAEVKIEETRVWAQASYIHWWVSRGNAPALISTNSGDPLVPSAGALGQPGTVVLLGCGPVGPNEFSGIQASVGMWLDSEKTQAFELAGFYVGKNSRQYTFASDSTGTPYLAQPIFVTGPGGGELALIEAQSRISTASVLVSNIMDFYGAEANWIINAYRINGWTFDYFAGARYLYLNDNLSLIQSITALPGGAGAIPFNGVFQPAGANFLLYDSFTATNRFYGGQIGARVNWTACGWELGAVMKLGVGATTHSVVIDGTSTLSVSGTTTTVPGGTLAQLSNIGQHNSTDASVVPELDITVSYQFTSWFRIFVGYNLLYWTNVERAGNQIDRRIDATQVPTSPTFVPGAVGTNPVFPNTRSDFWAQGLNVGFEFKF